jgi:hypothetical protein
MRLTPELLTEYTTLKQQKDAAYTVFKKEPSTINASRHAIATQRFTTFCIETMETLAGETTPDHSDDILANIENYRTCKKCEAEILYQVDEGRFIESSDFVPDFPGWCYPCLIEHCCKADCSACTLVTDPEKCSYKEIKKIYTDTEE